MCRISGLTPIPLSKILLKIGQKLFFWDFPRIDDGVLVSPSKLNNTIYAFTGLRAWKGVLFDLEDFLAEKKNIL